MAQSRPSPSRWASGSQSIRCKPLGLFLVLKAFNAVFNKKKEEAEEAPAEPTTKVCPYCQSEISIKAVRCPQCTSKLEGFPEIND